MLTYKSGSDPQIESLQNLQYTYDPVGNITQIRDHAQQTKYFNNAVVKAENRYEYDAVYQLVRASGRELAGTANDSIRTNSDLDFIPQIPYGNNADAVRTYTEEYEYDLLGNIKTLKHKFKAQAGGGNGWTRHYRYAFEDTPGDRTNRLVATSVTGDPDMGPYSAGYDHDVYGNMTRMPTLTPWTGISLINSNESISVEVERRTMSMGSVDNEFARLPSGMETRNWNGYTLALFRFIDAPS